MGVSDFWTALGAISALVAAVAATFAGVFTYRIMQVGQKQVEVSQEQNRQTLESERDAQLPVLIPSAPLETAGGLDHGYDRGQAYARVEVKNVGSGIALNLWGVIFEPEPELELYKVTGQHHFHHYQLPLNPGDKISKDWKGGGLPFAGDADLGMTAKYKLYAPSKPALGNLFLGASEIYARLTLTYSDVFGRKHAAIYDFTAQRDWVNVAYLRNIPFDLDDLARKAAGRIPVVGSPGLPST